MPQTSKIRREVAKQRDAVNGTYAWLKRQGLPPEVLQKVRVIANNSLILGMLVNIYEQEKFQDGLEFELFDE